MASDDEHQDDGETKEEEAPPAAENQEETTSEEPTTNEPISVKVNRRNNHGKKRFNFLGEPMISYLVVSHNIADRTV
jgi:hypothetical protein